MHERDSGTDGRARGRARLRRVLDLLEPAVVTIVRNGYTAERLRGDVFGGLTTAVIALPLALAFGVASGAGAIAGLYGAVAVGFFASLFGGTPAQVSGPTGPMTVVMGAVVATHAGSLAEAFTIVMLGGLLQMTFGALGLGRYVAYTPYSVISGFMTGIGVIIIVLQLLPLLGVETTAQGAVGALEQLATLDPAAIDGRAAALAGGALALIVLWPRQLNRWLPAPLVALVLGTLVSLWALPGLPTIGDVPAGLPGIVMPSLDPGALAQTIQAAFVLALLGSIDTLLTSLVADSITRGHHDADKELLGQGIGNCVAGLLGALPGAGATMRTLVNVRAGGRTPISGMLHALVLLALALGLGPLVERIPEAVLAAILIKVGWDILDRGYLKRVRSAPREKYAIMITTLVLTVFVDLITAVAVGIILASFVNSRWLATEQLKGLRQSIDEAELDELSETERELLRAVNGRVLVTMLHGSFSYASARELARRGGSRHLEHEAVVFDFSHAAYVDPSAALAIDELIESARDRRSRVLVSGLAGRTLATLDGLGVLDDVPAADRFARREDAIRAAAGLCRDRDAGG